MQHTTIGLDIAKQVFHAVGIAGHGKVVLRKKLSRRQVLPYFANQPPALVALEACATAHYWGRELRQLGHRVQLVPARAVKPYVQGNKNDTNDALAIAEAATRPGLREVRIKSVAEQDRQALHRLREGVLRARTRLSNQLRGLLAEYGIVLPKGVGVLRRALPELAADGGNGLSARFRALLAQGYEQLQHLEEQFASYDRELRAEVRVDAAAQRLLTIPGYGPVVTSAFLNAVGDGRGFRRGREVSASLGLVPRQHSTAGRPVLLRISKRGDGYVRSLFIHGARSVVRTAPGKDDALSRWVMQLVQRRGQNKATVALANKLARIGWAVLTSGGVYQPRRV